MKKAAHRFTWLALISYSALLVWGSEPAPDHRPDRFLGRWALDSRASTYSRDLCPREMTIEMTEVANGIHYHSVTTPQRGAVFTVDYTARYDGMPAFVTGSRGVLLPVTLRREDEDVVLATYSNGFVIVATSRRSLSKDGTTMTITTDSQDRSGANVKSIGVYRRIGTNPEASRE